MCYKAVKIRSMVTPNM